MNRKELRSAIESWLERGELRPTTFADAYRVRARRVVDEIEQMRQKHAVTITGEYQVFAARGISTWPIYAPVRGTDGGGSATKGERLAA